MAQIIIDSCIRGSFKGWKHNAEFEIVGGGKWKQTDSLYDYSYSYRPNAKIIYEGGYYKLCIDGMRDTVNVKKIS